jgi:anti-sigma B factor antagonist
MADATSVPLEQNGDTIVISPSGDMGTHESPTLRTALRAAVEKRPRRVVVDLSGVGYMATAGLATLVESLRATRDSSVELVLCNLQPRVKAVFDIARLSTVFRIVTTLEEAKQ